MGRGRSVHIGLNRVDETKYADADGKPWAGALSACENDAANMRRLAEEWGFEATTLLTAQATADGIIASLREAAEALTSGDMFFISYSGHGGQLPETDGDESDGIDETWVAFDRQVRDDEIALELTRFAPGVRVLGVSDSCYSGSVFQRVGTPAGAVLVNTAANASFEARLSKAMPGSVAAADFARREELYRGIRRSVPHFSESSVRLRASVLLMAACEDHEIAAATREHSLFTDAFVATMEPSFSGTYLEFLEIVRKRLGSVQTPKLTPLGPGGQDFLAQRPLSI